MTPTDAPPRLATVLSAHGLPPTVYAYPGSTRTAADAAAAIGCPVAAIGKSLVFMGAESGTPVVVIASGANRVDEARVAALIGEPIRKASADEVRAGTGHAIGGVPPFGHPTDLRTILDPDLLVFDPVWVAAGTPKTVFPITPDALRAASRATVAPIA
ncbi:YbaK/EbsC family protein [Roseospira marina]|uniref:YbaK/EbsC family protein n=1 Tax=Roseospira marina TaxID=140057 RepID=A0A5M6IE07_9PROT|nr:YbaK/EbsC family protein [Roseospira marina]KAA5606473.1 YbaK/EbsC family protein [Roseospira marina]MBB4314107.1 prolyl-tRNA editing enzyme YbaK/EbsC (Cys-tRNA(Pro) deacylase) [Roseospira marina]MBB5087268.1 prolyl-tRNA editing enzyme YbaK/EbsC (Cys-tRNA(Pro) deacylase) [Roseospira marina]